MLAKLYSAVMFVACFLVVYWGMSQLYRMLDLSHGAAR